MSIEYSGRTQPPLSEESVEEVLDAVANGKGYRVLRRTGHEIGVARETCVDGTEETITIDVAGDNVYVAFHVATSDEREQLLEFIQNMLVDMGHQCEFEEL